MTTKERIAAINTVLAHHKNLEQAWEPAIKVFGTHDNSLHEASWRVFDEYIREVEKRIGDTFQWISWYIYDNECGEQAMKAKASNWKKSRQINSVAMLVKLIEADL